MNEIRPIGPEEFEAYVATQGTAFGFDPSAEVREQEQRVFEFQ